MKAHSGVTLVELLISLVIGLFVMSVLIQSYVNTKQHQAVTLHYSQIEQDANYALQLLAKDIRRSGYLGALLSDKTILGSLPPPVPNKRCNYMDWGSMIQQAMLGFNDSLTHNVQYTYAACIKASHYLRGDLITLRYLSANTILHTELKDTVNQNRLYMRTSSTAGLLFQGKDYNKNYLPIIANSEVRRVLSHTYFIGSSSIPSDTSCKNKSTTPALFRLRLNNNGRLQREELLQGVENMQFLYDVDSNQDGITDQILQAHEIMNWQDVRLVHISITMYQPCITSKNNSYSTRVVLKNKRA